MSLYFFTVSEEDRKQPRVVYHFIKGNHFRVVAADGAWGGVTPNGDLSVSFYNERFPIPTKVTHQITGLKLGAEIVGEREAKDGIVREFEVAVHLKPVAARALLNWLTEKLGELEHLQALADAAEREKGTE